MNDGTNYLDRTDEETLTYEFALLSSAGEVSNFMLNAGC